MSNLINDDKKVLEGNREALDDVAVPLREQIVKKLYNKLNEMEIGKKVVESWTLGSSDRADWLDRQQVYLNDIDEFLAPTNEGPFKGASDLHLPMSFTVCKTFHARFLQALLSLDPPFTVEAQQEANVEREQMVQELMRYALFEWANHYDGIDDVIDRWLWQWVTTGVGFVKWNWDVEYQRIIDVVEVQEPGPPQLVIDEETGKEQLVPTFRKVEKEQKITKKCFDGPALSLIMPEDLLIIDSKDGHPQRAEKVIERGWLNASQLWTGVDRKLYDEDVVREIIDSGNDARSTDIAAGLKLQRAINSAGALPDSEYEEDKYEILEAYLKVDVDGSGINSDVVVWVHKRSMKLLRATYLYRINKAGERPYSKILFMQREGSHYGMGLPEIMHPLSVELDAIRNMRIDFGMISTMPFGFYRATSNIDADTLELAPGALIPVDNPQTDVYFPNMGPRTAFGFQEEQAIMTMIERLTGISDLSLGVISGNQGPTRTASGVRAVVGETNANLDVFLKRLNLGWTSCLQYLFHMLQQRLPPGLSFRIHGDMGAKYWLTIKSYEEIAGDYDFVVSSNSAHSNPQVKQDVASQLLQITGNPLDIQLGIIGPSQRFEAMKNYVQALGVKDWGRFLARPQQSRILAPVEEMNRILRGIEVPVELNMDHEGYLKLFQEIQDNDELLGQYNEIQTVLLAAQALRHQQAIQALQAQQAQIANSQQMMMNAQQGAALQQGVPGAGGPQQTQT